MVLLQSRAAANTIPRRGAVGKVTRGADDGDGFSCEIHALLKKNRVTSAELLRNVRA
jgi:hypothetical protein